MYALYEGDKFITMGTKEEIAKELGVKVSTVQYYTTPSQYKRTKGKGRILISLKEKKGANENGEKDY